MSVPQKCEGIVGVRNPAIPDFLVDFSFEWNQSEGVQTRFCAPFAFSSQKFQV